MVFILLSNIQEAKIVKKYIIQFKTKWVWENLQKTSKKICNSMLLSCYHRYSFVKLAQ